MVWSIHILTAKAWPFPAQSGALQNGGDLKCKDQVDERFSFCTGIKISYHESQLLNLLMTALRSGRVGFRLGQ